MSASLNRKKSAFENEMGSKPKIVIVGAGFGGLTAAKKLRSIKADITLVDQRNYHLFQPLLYQVATAGLSPADIAWPIRSIVARQKNLRVLMRSVTNVDVDKQQLDTDGGSVPYDYLILAPGARHSYFGNDDWETDAPGLKSIEDATEIRRRVLSAFEMAESSEDPYEQRCLLTFVVVGGGPTGVEMAGAIAELSRHALTCDFSHIDPSSTRVVLIEGSDRLLAGFNELLSTKAKSSLERLGVQILTGVRVDGVDNRGVNFGDDRISSRTVIWAAGVKAAPAARWLGVSSDDRAERVIVNADLSVPGLENIYVIGDAALHHSQDGKATPGIAPAAKQMGEYVAAQIKQKVNPVAKKQPSDASETAFRYRHHGSLATIGRKSAVIDFGRTRLSGSVAWLIWGVAHIYFLIGIKNKTSVVLSWLWDYATFERGARLITGSPPEALPANSVSEQESEVRRVA
ncbi:MAG: NAD(P)/FAD-dependent oxidoreductase [Pseudomonadota bacterium]